VGPITLWLGVAAAVALTISLIPRRRGDHDDVAAAYALALVWIAGSGARTIFGEWQIGLDLAYLYVGPVSDVILLACMVYLARWNPAHWLRVLIALAAFQLLAHVAYGLGDKTRELRDTYKLTLNVSYVAELICAATPGGLHGVRRLLDHLRDRRRLAGQGSAR
jgi:hypothetical protein